MHGALLVDKPSGPTSHDIVGFTRRLLKTTRVGHTGTLDPLATGLLVILVGHATRLAQFLVGDEKEYIADVRLGVSTPTYDAASLDDGVRRTMTDDRWPMDEDVERVLDTFRGSFQQTPPPFSAKKVAGVAAYVRARRNESVDLKPVLVTVRELQVLPTSTIKHRSSAIGPDPSAIGPDPSAIGHRPSVVDRNGLLRLRVTASAGFYVRSLAHDLGQRLGCGAHLEALRRTRVGRFRVDDAATLETLQAEGGEAAGRVIPMNRLLADLPSVSLTPEGLRRAANGNSLAPVHLSTVREIRAGDRVRVLDASGELFSVAEQRPDGLLHPLLVLR